jgi:hypothetical protein
MASQMTRMAMVVVLFATLQGKTNFSGHNYVTGTGRNLVESGGQIYSIVHLLPCD